MTKPYILVLHGGYPGGKIEAMSRIIAEGVAKLQAVDVRIRAVSHLDLDISHPYNGDVLVTLDDFEHASGVILGSPTRFGNMCASLKQFLDQTGGLWMRHVMSGKPCGFFTASGTMHGGQESTLLSMMIPMLHHGMLIVGVPFSETALSTTKGGGTPYGASHVTGTDYAHARAIDEEEAAVCRALGSRVADIAIKLLAS